jgi:hypothetical protein
MNENNLSARLVRLDDETTVNRIIEHTASKCLALEVRGFGTEHLIGAIEAKTL